MSIADVEVDCVIEGGMLGRLYCKNLMNKERKVEIWTYTPEPNTEKRGGREGRLLARGYEISRGTYYTLMKIKMSAS